MVLGCDEHGNRIVWLKLPKGVKGCTAENDDGSSTIFISEYLSYIEQRRVYQHELKHILRGHFGRDINLNDAESDASE